MSAPKQRKIALWDKRYRIQAILEDLRWEDVWRESQAFQDLTWEERLRWKEHVVNSELPIGRVLRYDAYLSVPPCSQNQTEAIEKDFPAEDFPANHFWYKFGKILHIVDDQGLHRVVPFDEARAKQNELDNLCIQGKKNKDSVVFNVTARERGKEDREREQSRGLFAPHIAARANRVGFTTLRDRAGPTYRKLTSKLDLSVEEVRTLRSVLTGRATRKYAPYTSVNFWFRDENNAYVNYMKEEKFIEDDVWDVAHLYLYQDVEAQSLASYIGSRVHERLMAFMVEKDKAYAPLLPDSTIPEKLKGLLLGNSPEGHILGYSNSRERPFYENILKQLYRMFNAIPVAVEYPVHHPNLCFKDKSNLVLLETRLDAVLKLKLVRTDEFVVVEYKTINGSKWAEKNPIKRIRELLKEAVVQALTNAYLFQLNTGLSVKFIAVVFIERKREAQHVFKLLYEAEIAKKLCENLFALTKSVYVNSKGVWVASREAIYPLPNDSKTNKIAKLNISIPDLLGPKGGKKFKWSTGPRSSDVRATVVLEPLVGNYVTYKKEKYFISRISNNAEKMVFIVARDAAAADAKEVKLQDLQWHKGMFLPQWNKLKFNALHMLRSKEDDKIIRQRSAMYELALLLHPDDFFEENRLDMFAVASRFSYDAVKDEFSLDREPIPDVRMGLLNDKYERWKIVGIAPSATKGKVRYNISRSSTRTLDVHLPTLQNSWSMKIKKAMIHRLGAKAGVPVRTYTQTREYLGWAVQKPPKNKLRTLFGGDGEKWEHYYNLLNEGWGDSVDVACVYPTGCYSVSQFTSNRRELTNEGLPFKPTENLESMVLSLSDFSDKMLHKDNPELLEYLKNNKCREYNDLYGIEESESDVEVEVESESESEVDSESEMEMYAGVDTESEEDFEASSSRVFRDGCVPSYYCADAESQIAGPRKSTTLQIPPQRAELHRKLLRASETVSARISNDVAAMHSNVSFEAACQAFEKTPADCLHAFDKKQSLDVRAYRALNRRINRLIFAKYEETHFVVNDSSRSMWKLPPLKEALDMVDGTKVELVDFLQSWGSTAVDPSDIAFDGFDF